MAGNLIQISSFFEVAIDVLHGFLTRSTSSEHLGWVCLRGDGVLKLDAFSDSPVHITANGIKALGSQVLLHSWVGSSSLGFGGVNLSLHGSSLSLAKTAVVVVDSEHPVVWLSVHLDWEDGGLVWQSLKSHLVNPWLEVEAFNGWDSVVLLLLSNLVVVLAWRVHSEHHSLGTQNSSVVPLGLQVWLGNIVQVADESALEFLDVSKSELITNHVLLSDTERSHSEEVFWFFSGVLGPSKRGGWSVRSLSTDLVSKLHVLSVQTDIVVSLVFHCVDSEWGEQ